jgi:hypothetical protein
VIYLQEAAYYEDQAELEHQLIQSVVWSGRGRACAWAPDSVGRSGLVLVLVPLIQAPFSDTPI